MLRMTKVIYLFIGFIGIVVGVVSAIPWAMLAVARRMVKNRSQKGK